MRKAIREKCILTRILFFVMSLILATAFLPWSDSFAETPASQDAISFDLAKGSVTISSTGYSGYSSGWTSGEPDVTGTHSDTNKYYITQSGDTSTGTENNITLTGSESDPVPEFDVTIDDINCKTDNHMKQTINTGNGINITYQCKVLLRLDGVNQVGRLHYSSGKAVHSLDASLPSSLTITNVARDGTSNGGTLKAESTATWAAAIGGVDEPIYEEAFNVVIEGGTVEAISKGTAAIGGGGNAAATVTISGGRVTATNSGAGATIGGGGAANSYGGAGKVTISGGTVTATNNGNGAALGGGGSVESYGGEGRVTISGGTVTAVNSSNSNNCIGGGNSVNSTGGASDVNISGGTVTAGKIGGGIGKTNVEASSVNTITGGSVNASSITSPTNGSANGTKTLTGHTYNSISGVAADDEIWFLTIDSSIGYEYGINDVRTDSNNNLYLWLPSEIKPGITANDRIVFDLSRGAVTISGTNYSGKSSSGGDVTGNHDNSNKYLVIQSDASTATENNIIITGDSPSSSGDLPEFDVTIDGINNATGMNFGQDVGTRGGIMISNRSNVILKLKNENKIGRLNYYTTDNNSVTMGIHDLNRPTESTLTITSILGDGYTSGTLIAESQIEWSAAIGGTDNGGEDTYDINIKGGTIEAKSIYTAAIGGGGNGWARIEISGGDVTATNRGTGATIGGGGGLNSSGGAGKVTVSGGTVKATNAGTGVALGGGGSDKSDGSEGRVIISGGFITAGSEGGNNVGGGNTNNTDTPSSTGGNAEINISGGTVSAGHIGGGKSKTNGYASGTVVITGGSIKCSTSATPTNGNKKVYPTRVSLYDTGGPFTDADLSSIGVQVLPSDIYHNGYGINDVKSDENSALYVFLPKDTAVHTAVAHQSDGRDVIFTGDVPSNNIGVLTSGDTNFYSVRAIQSDRYDLFTDQACTKPFEGAANVKSGEAFTFYMKKNTDKPFNAVAAYEYDADSNSMVNQQTAKPVNMGGDTYSYTFGNVTRNMEVWFATTTENDAINRLDLDFTNDIVIKANDEHSGNFDITRGSYKLTDFSGKFYLTSGGINSNHNLTVLSGAPNIYLNKLNLTPEGSGIYIREGSTTISYSVYDNTVESSGAPAITVSSGAILNVNTDADDKSLTLSSDTASAIGGAGTVNITKTAGFLDLNSPNNIEQITASKYSYQVASQSTGTTPYTFKPSVGELVGYNDGEKLMEVTALPEVSQTGPTYTTYTACSLACVGFSDPQPESSITSDGQLQISGIASAASPTVMRDSTILTGTDYTYNSGTLIINAPISGGNIVVNAKQVKGISVAGPTNTEYNHGDSLILDGLTATLIYSDETNSGPIQHTNFADYGIIVSPQSGQVLYTEANHGKPITVSYGNSSIKATTEVNLTVNPTVVIVGNPMAGYTVSASSDGQAGDSYQWQMQEPDTEQWVAIEGATGASYVPSIDYINKKIRIVVTFESSSGAPYSGTVESTSVTILENTPSYIITIPSTVDMSSGESFNIDGEISSFAPGNILDLKVRGSGTDGTFDMTLGGAPGISLNYQIYKQNQQGNKENSAINPNDTLVSFSSNGSKTTKAYYTVSTPAYAGTFSGTITFTVDMRK